MSVSTVVPAAVSRLRAASGVLALPETDLGRDETAGIWVFQGSDDLVPFRDPKGTGTSAVSVAVTGSWSSNPHNTMNFPRLTVAVFADTSRGEGGEPILWDGHYRALRVWEALDAVLHDPANADRPAWLAAGTPVLSCLRETVHVAKVPGMDGMHRLTCDYSVVM